MPNLKISQLNDGNPAQPADQIPINRAGVNYRITVSTLSTITAVVSAKTANYSVLTTDSSVFFTNTGASGEVDFTLPTGAAGLRYSFYIDNAQIVKIIATGGAKVRSLSTLSGANGNIQAAVQGNSVSLVCIGTSGPDAVTEWVTDTIFGTWTIT